MKITQKSVLFALGFLAVAVIHFFLSFVTSFSAGIGGGPIYLWASRILTFPLWLIPSDGSGGDSSLIGWLPLVAISLIWSWVICFGLRFLLLMNAR
jgi:hypothetical protein